MIAKSRFGSTAVVKDCLQCLSSSCHKGMPDWRVSSKPRQVSAACQEPCTLVMLSCSSVKLEDLLRRYRSGLLTTLHLQALQSGSGSPLVHCEVLCVIKHALCQHSGTFSVCDRVVQEIVREAADVQELAEESFGEHLADYPTTELLGFRICTTAHLAR